MSEYRTNNTDAVVSTAAVVTTVTAVTPLFASSWLALYYILRENFNARRASTRLPEHISLINGDHARRTSAN